MNRINKMKKIITNAIIIILFLTIACIIIKFPNIGKKENDNVDFSGVNRICELATLRCYYHDVASFKDDPKPIFKYGLFKYGYKKYWVEYEGIVEIGIDMDEVEVNQPNKKNIVYLYVPEAKIMSISADKKSMGDPITETGKFTTIKTEEKAQAFSKAQKKMKKNTETDKSLLRKAKLNATVLLKQYIVNIGKQVGKNYTVKLLDKPLAKK